MEGGEYRTSYKVGHAVGFLADISVMDRKSEISGAFQSNTLSRREGKFVIPLPFKGDAVPLGESRTIAVQRFLVLESSLHAKAQFGEFAACIKEYFELGHAEPFLPNELNKEDYYMLMHAIQIGFKHYTTKLMLVLDAPKKELI